MYNVRLLSRMNYTLQNSNITNNYCTVNIGYIKYNSQHIKTNNTIGIIASHYNVHKLEVLVAYIMYIRDGCMYVPAS